MKIIVRTIIILVAALIVVAAAVGFAQSSFAVALAPNLPAEQRVAAPVFVTSAAATEGSDAAGSSVTFSPASSAATGTAATGTTQAGTATAGTATAGTATAGTATAGTATAGTAAAGTGEAPVFAGEGSRPDHGEDGGIQGALPLAKNFAIMALIVAAVALGSQGLARLRLGRMRLQVR